MSKCSLAVICAVALLTAACSSTAPEVSSDDWVGTITTEGNVTTVVNESGSVWGGAAMLVEEISIGVDVGPDEYMFGNVEGVAVTGDRIFVLDRSVPVLRVYDLAGNHLLDMGRAGQGPGEFTNPYLLAVSQDGRVFVRTFAGLVVFDHEGGHVMTITERGGIVLPMVAGNDALYMPVQGGEGSGHVLVGADGSRGPRMLAPSLVDWPPWGLMAQGNGGSRQQSVPYSPATVWTLAPNGSVIQAASDEYRIEVKNPNGTVLLIERDLAAVPIGDSEREWHEASTALPMRRLQPDWTWNANPIPASKPFFQRFYTDADGVLWVRRITGTESVTDCDAEPTAAFAENRPPRPCFRDVEAFDVFATDGRYMGEVEIPAMQRREHPAIDGDTVVQAIEDEAGTIMVKRYRLMLPGEKEH